MLPAPRALQAMYDHGARVWAEEDRVRYESAAALPDQLVATLAQDKKSTLDWLLANPNIIFVGPPSHAQDRLIYLYDECPDSAAYNLPFAFRIRAPLQGEHLEAALRLLINRHEALRTVFIEHNGGRLQCILHESTVLPLTWRTADEPTLEQFIKEESTRPFVLSQSPLFRISHISLPDTSAVVLLVCHHIICDGWSLEIFFSELASAYEHVRRKAYWNPPPINIQYAEYSLAQKTFAGSRQREIGITYWREKLAGELPILRIPGDRAPPDQRTYNGLTHRFPIPEETALSLANVGKALGVTEFTVYLCIYRLTLFRLMGEADIIIGTPVAGRTQKEYETIVGCFTNTLPLRCAVNLLSSMRDTLDREQATVSEALSYQDTPFDAIVAAVDPPRDPRYAPIIQTMFTMGAYRPPTLIGDLQSAHALEIETNTSKFDLSCIIVTIDDRTEARFEFNTDLLHEDTVRRFADAFIRIAKVGIQNLDIPLAEALRLESYSTCIPRRTNARYSSVSEWFSAVTNQFASESALVQADRKITYENLNLKAERLAARLRLVAGSDAPFVGICMHRSVELVVAILAVIKIGRAYALLDPGYPDERRATMVRDAQIEVILTADNTNDVDEICINKFSDGQLWQKKTFANAVYLVFTSGSTGKPKGIVIEHSNLINLVSWYIDEYHPAPGEKCTLVSGVSFDALGWELWSALLSGGEIHILSNDLVLTYEVYKNYLTENRIQIGFLPTPLCETYLQNGWQCGLRILFVGGDQLGQAYDIQGKLINIYGPTECTIVSTAYQVVPSDGGVVPIGHPIRNAHLQVRDERGEISEPGAVGELYISGEGVGWGYINPTKDDLERFTRDNDGTRRYRTGDIVRERHDGEFIFLGRRDRLTKVRGYRIELEEVESVMRSIPGVHKAVVLCVKDRTGDSGLRAFFTGDATAENLRENLSVLLPEYMVPSLIERTNLLPLTLSGKIDRAALLERTKAALSPKTQESTDLERVLADAFATQLERKSFDIHEDFFVNGGTSLKAVRVAFEIWQKIGLMVSIPDIIEARTPFRLAGILEGRLGKRPGPPVAASSDKPPQTDHPQEARG